ncbi:thioredoxin family protein [Cytobacillus oceanisediminis]|uniref:Thioredoxin family protein n=1 Tax=Niallia alba TaxID=2729105 RepID=A0A7Y0KC57_9BACI|nr:MULTISPECIES: thioredoxin family protein [Bacillaceae]EOR24170.1 thioredoxin [Niallia nealsonii AAU1]MBQ6446894.1 thioredoxin family protein [Bacillus sp. (in: firmicutes)]MDU1847608.1 thioredoxin family protein [Niallia nealsonii]MBZ9535306.1 thioredoxin family protein [Cytobacillus oceanisediminis]MED3791847.1 thioredoxin family protein [Niallia alba]
MIEWKPDQWEKQIKDASTAFFYLYTPLCGTCMVASKMLTVLHTMKPDLNLGKMDLNYAPDLATKFEVESVPCLLIIENGELKEKVYRFESVPHLLEVINKYTR